MVNDNKSIAANRLKRPLYGIGSQVRVVAEGTPYHDWQGEVVGIRPMQDMAGYVATYMYTLRMENLGRQDWAEERLAFVANAPFEPWHTDYDDMVAGMTQASARYVYNLLRKRLEGGTDGE